MKEYSLRCHNIHVHVLEIMDWQSRVGVYTRCTFMAKISANPDLLGQLYAKVRECTNLDRQDSTVREQPQTQYT